MTRKQYSINGSYRLNQNLAVLRRKTEKTNKKILGEIINPLTELLAGIDDSGYSVIRQGNCLIIRVFNRKEKNGDCLY